MSTTYLVVSTKLFTSNDVILQSPEKCLLAATQMFVPTTKLFGKVHIDKIF